MSDYVAVNKDSDHEQKIPTDWRDTLFKIVEAFRRGDFELQNRIDRVYPIQHEEAQRIKKNIQSYGGELSDLSDESWDSSIYIWMDGYWDILVDLIVDNDVSDLVLFLRAREKEKEINFEIRSVHVP
jgi:hypothetical protein